MRAMNDPRYQYQPWTEERRAAASAAAKARIAATKRVFSRIPMPGNYAGSIHTSDDFARCSTDRQIQIMHAILNCMAVYRRFDSSKQTELLAMMMDQWITMSCIVARQSAQVIEDRNTP